MCSPTCKLTAWEVTETVPLSCPTWTLVTQHVTWMETKGLHSIVWQTVVYACSSTNVSHLTFHSAEKKLIHLPPALTKPDVAKRHRRTRLRTVSHSPDTRHVKGCALMNEG